MSFLDFLSKRIKLLRTERKESQQFLGDAIHITKASVSRIESATQSVTIETLLSIADHYDVSVDFILGRTDVMQIPSDNIINLTKEEEILLNNFRCLDNISKGKLIERSRMLLEETNADIMNSKKKNA